MYIYIYIYLYLNYIYLSFFLSFYLSIYLSPASPAYRQSQAAHAISTPSVVKRKTTHSTRT